SRVLWYLFSLDNPARQDGLGWWFCSVPVAGILARIAEKEKALLRKHTSLAALCLLPYLFPALASPAPESPPDRFRGGAALCPGVSINLDSPAGAVAANLPHERLWAENGGIEGLIRKIRQL